MAAASTEMFSFVSIRAVIRFFTAEKRSVLIETHTEKIVMAISRRMFLDGSTRANRSWFIIGEIMPISDRASVARAIITKSEAESARKIYAESEVRLIFFSGKGL